MSDFLSTYGGIIFIAIILAVFIVLMVFSSKKRKKQEQDAQDLINAVGPGNKVKTIGGICGIVVEVDKEENTFILETGSESTGKCYIKFDKQAIYQTDAVAAPKTEATSDEVMPEAPAEGEVEADTNEQAPADNTTEIKE